MGGYESLDVTQQIFRAHINGGFVYIIVGQQQQQKNIYCVLIGPYVVVDGNFVIRDLTILIINIRIGSVNQFFAIVK